MPMSDREVTEADEWTGSRWSKRERWALATFAAAVFASLTVLVHSWYDPVRDGSIYIGTAKSLLSGEGYRYVGVPFVTRLPGFTALITPFIAAFGVQFYILNLGVSLFGATGVVLLAAFLRNRVGLGLGILTATVVWLNPGYQKLCNQVMTDVPGMALVFACLLLERWASRKDSWRRELLLGLAIGLSTYVRSLSLLLVPAIAASRAWRVVGTGMDASGWLSFVARRIVPMAAVTLLLLAPWSVRNRVQAPPAPVDQFTVYDYGTAMWHVDSGDPESATLSLDDVLARTPLRFRQISDVLGSRLQKRVRGNEEPRETTPPLHVAVALLLAAGCLRVLIKRRAPAEFFAVATLLVMSVYFGFLDRLVLPLYVLGLAATVELLRDLFAAIGGTRFATWVTIAALLGLLVVDLDPRQDWSGIEARHRDHAQLAGALEQQLPAGARIGAPLGFTYSVYLDRPVYSLLIAIRRAGDPSSTYADTARARGVLGWEPRYGLGDILDTAFRWHQQQYVATG